MNARKQGPPEVVRLTDEEIAALQDLAIQTNSLAERGPTAGQPSWRTLIKRIAKGEITLKLQD